MAKHVDKLPLCMIHVAREELDNQIDLAYRLVDTINRGLEITDQIKTQYKPNDIISPEVRDYILDYEDACEALGWHNLEIGSSCESAWSVLKSIIESLWRMLMKLWDHIKNAFRYIFSARYRASKDAIKFQQQIALCGANRKAREQFVNLTVDCMLKVEDLNKYMDSTKKVMDLLEKVATMDDLSAIDEFVTTEVANAGLVRRGDEFVDTYGKLPWVAGTYKELGYEDTAFAEKAAEKFVKICQQTVNLKKLEKSLDDDKAELKRKQNNLIADGADASTVQGELTKKLLMYQIVFAGQRALAARIENLTSCFEQIATDCDDLTSGRYENVNDD